MSAQAILFFLLAFIAVVSAVMVISRDNPVHSALWLILNLMSIAVLYYTLQAPFLMAVQLIVYAGAIVVLFVFVVMLLLSKGQSGGTPGPMAWLPPATYIAALLLGVVLLMVAFAQPKTVGSALLPVVGTPTEVGRVLYRDYLLPFEATSILLLAALVGALYLGRHSSRDDEDEEPAEIVGIPETEETPLVRIPEDINV